MKCTCFVKSCSGAIKRIKSFEMFQILWRLCRQGHFIRFRMKHIPKKCSQFSVIFISWRSVTSSNRRIWRGAVGSFQCRRNRGATQWRRNATSGEIYEYFKLEIKYFWNNLQYFDLWNIISSVSTASSWFNADSSFFVSSSFLDISTFFFLPQVVSVYYGYKNV